MTIQPYDLDITLSREFYIILTNPKFDTDLVQFSQLCQLSLS